MGTLPLLGLSIAHGIHWRETVEETDLFRETADIVGRRCPSIQFVGFYRSARDVSHESMRWYRVRAQLDDSPIVEAVPSSEVSRVVSYLESLDRNEE